VDLFFNSTDLFFLIFLNTALILCFTDLSSELFYLDKTMMVFGDAKKVVEDMVKAVE
jgi:NAD/NADP transhydrogenase beta subunit